MAESTSIERPWATRSWLSWEIVLCGIVLGAFATVAWGDHTGFFRCEQDYLANGLEMAMIEAALGVHLERTGAYPSTEEGLAALASQFPDGLPDDRWGHPFHYRAPVGDSDSYALFSLGRDGRKGGFGQDADIDHTEFCDGRPRTWGD